MTKRKTGKGKLKKKCNYN